MNKISENLNFYSLININKDRVSIRLELSFLRLHNPEIKRQVYYSFECQSQVTLYFKIKLSKY